MLKLESHKGNSMNIENDIEKFKLIGAKAIQEELKLLKEEIRTKQYFFKVVDILNQLDELIKNDTLSKYGIKALKLQQAYDYDLGEVFSEIEILDEKNQSIHIYNQQGNYIIGYELVYNLLSRNYLVLEEDLYNPSVDKKVFTVPLDENTKNVLKGYLLNDTLLKAYHYMELLDRNPPKTNKEKTIKRKI